MADDTPIPYGYLLNTWQFVATIKDPRGLATRDAKIEPLYSGTQYAALQSANSALAGRLTELESELASFRKSEAASISGITG